MAGIVEEDAFDLGKRSPTHANRGMESQKTGMHTISKGKHY
jgi:hypothetical protein